MRIVVDAAKCTGHARCAFYGPAVYLLDDVGFCRPLDVEVPPELEAEALAGAQACPEQAIEVLEE